MIQRNAWKLSIALFASLGCGDDEGGKTAGPGAPSTAGTCADVCEGMRAARCNVDLARCESLCEQQYAATPASCRATADQLLDCASKATFSCGAEGPEATFCRELETRLDLCSGAGPVDAGGQPTLDAGTPTQDAGAAPVVGDAAASPGDASTLPTSRSDAGGGDASATTDASASGDASLPSDAGPVQAISCQPAADDNACDRCIKGSCCSEVQACGRDCQLLGACVADCETDACYEACAQQHPAGFEQFDAVLTCTTDECESACDDTAPAPNGARPPPSNCLPTFAPAGTCTDPSRPIGYDCKGAPFTDCVALPDISDVYCCARG